jgi:hypothetical protein
MSKFLEFVVYTNLAGVVTPLLPKRKYSASLLLFSRRRCPKGG